MSCPGREAGPSWNYRQLEGNTVNIHTANRGGRQDSLPSDVMFTYPEAGW